MISGRNYPYFPLCNASHVITVDCICTQHRTMKIGVGYHYVGYEECVTCPRSWTRRGTANKIALRTFRRFLPGREKGIENRRRTFTTDPRPGLTIDTLHYATAGIVSIKYMAQRTRNSRPCSLDHNWRQMPAKTGDVLLLNIAKPVSKYCSLFRMYFGSSHIDIMSLHSTVLQNDVLDWCTSEAVISLPNSSNSTPSTNVTMDPDLQSYCALVFHYTIPST